MGVLVFLFVGLIVALMIVIVIVKFALIVLGRDPETGEKVDSPEYRKRKQEEHEKLEALQARLEDYVTGTACIGLSPYCKGRKSRGAIVCKNCYLAQGFDRPIGFAQSGGGATKGELGQMVVARLGYQKVGPGQWRRD